MTLQIHASMVVLLLATIAVIVSITLAWQRRHTPGAPAFLLFMSALTFYLVGYAIEIGSQSVALVTWLAKIEYIGIVLIPPCSLILAIQFINKGYWLTPRRIALLMLIPAITLIFAWTNESHRLIWESIQISNEHGITQFSALYGSWFFVHSWTSFLMLSATILLLLYARLRYQVGYRKQLNAMLIATLLPFFAVNLHFSDYSPFLINPTPFALTITGFIMAWALFRYQYFNLIPTAKDRIIETIEDGLIVVDLHHRVVLINETAVTLFGIPRNEIIGQNVHKILPRFSTCLGHATLEVETSRLVVCVEGGKKQLSLDVTVSSLTDRKAHIQGYFILLHDVTPLIQAAETMQQAKETAEIAHRLKSEFLRNVSHELRTPLTTILLYTDLVQRLAADSENNALRSRLLQIQEAGRQLSSLLDLILEISLVEAGDVSFQIEQIDLRNFISDVTAQLPPALAENGNHFTLAYQDELKSFSADRGKLQRMIISLIDYAAHTTEDGEISLRISTEKREQQRPFVRFEISDTGRGMTQEQVNLLFEPFATIDLAQSINARNASLALVLSQRICEKMGGKMHVRSVVGEGSTVSVTLPN